MGKTRKRSHTVCIEGMTEAEGTIRQRHNNLLVKRGDFDSFPFRQSGGGSCSLRGTTRELGRNLTDDVLGEHGWRDKLGIVICKMISVKRMILEKASAKIALTQENAGRDPD